MEINSRLLSTYLSVSITFLHTMLLALQRTLLQQTKAVALSPGSQVRLKKAWIVAPQSQVPTIGQSLRRDFHTRRADALAGDRRRGLVPECAVARLD